MESIRSAVRDYSRVTLLLVATVIAVAPMALATQPEACAQNPLPPSVTVCPDGIPLQPGTFHQTPLIDGSTSTRYPDPVSGPETVTLYGQLGTNETQSQPGMVHRSIGIARANSIVPITGPSGEPPAIVVLFIGISNCELEVCGGFSDAWDFQYNHGLIPVRVVGQACATQCPNPHNGNTLNSWNDAGDGIRQQSLLWQAYSPDSPGPRVGSHVYLFNGAKGGEFLGRWDPNSPDNDCQDKECNYTRVAADLANNGFSESQVQVIVLHAANGYPYCDLAGDHCRPDIQDKTPDAYRAEATMGDIVRYLKQGYNGHPPRYPNLKQVFLMSRNYGGYARNAPTDAKLGCVNPEPFAYELAFSVQRLIVAQVNQTYPITSPDNYSGTVDYSNAPWFDWGPYLWASGQFQRSTDLLNWCNNNPGTICEGHRDFRFGNVADDGLYGDLTHPRWEGQQKAAAKILEWLTDPNNAFVAPWIGQ